MPLASSSAVAVRAIKEATFGVTPGTGNPVELRVTSESLDYQITKESSKEINLRRTISSMVPTTAAVSGDLGCEISYAAHDFFLESVMQSAFSVFGTNGVGVATPTTSITTTVITATAATSGSSIFTNLRRGQWFRIQSAGANNGRIVRVSPVTAPTTTVLTVDTNTPLVASSGESIQVQTSRLTHASTRTSFTLERFNSDIGVFIAYRGCTPSKMNVNIQSGGLSAMTFSFMGKDAMDGVATMLPGTVQAAPTYDIHSGVSGATNAVWMDGAPLSGTFVKSVSLDFDNALRAQDAIGTLGAVDLGTGTINCTASAQIYFADRNLFTKFRQNQNSSLVFSTTDAAGNGYIITVPVANITSWKSNAGAKDQDMMLDIQFTAMEDSANADVNLRKVVFIDRIGAAVVPAL